MDGVQRPNPLLPGISLLPGILGPVGFGSRQTSVARDSSNKCCESVANSKRASHCFYCCCCCWKGKCALHMQTTEEQLTPDYCCSEARSDWGCVGAPPIRKPLSSDLPIPRRGATHNLLADADVESPLENIPLLRGELCHCLPCVGSSTGQSCAV